MDSSRHSNVAWATPLIPVVLVLCVLSSQCMTCVGKEVDRLENVGEWWYAELPETNDSLPPGARAAIIRTAEFREHCLKGLKALPAEVRPVAAYIYRLKYFPGGGAPRDTPAGQYADFVGVTLSGTDLICAIVRKAKAAPEFMSATALRRLLHANFSLPGVVAGALAVLNEFSEKEIETWKERAKTEEGFTAKKVLAAIECREACVNRLEYGITQGPVGPNAVQIAIEHLSQLRFGSVSDDRWIKCVEIVGKSRDPKGLRMLFAFAGWRTVEDPSDKPWNPSPVGKYPAASAILGYRADAVAWVTDQFKRKDREAEISIDDQTLVNILVAIMSPDGFPPWIAELEKSFEKDPGDPQLRRIHRLKAVFEKTKYIPQYVKPYPFHGPITRNEKDAP